MRSNFFINQFLSRLFLGGDILPNCNKIAFFLRVGID
jgi:hypothetical protein